MCQVYYVRGFIELIYFVPVSFNQGQFMHTGWAEGEGGGEEGVVLEWAWLLCHSASEWNQLYSERNSADEDG